MRLRLQCLTFLMIFMTSVLSHAHVFSSFNKDKNSFSQYSSNDSSKNSDSDKCADNTVHFCGCVHFVVLKSIDLKLNSKSVSGQDYLQFTDQLVQQEFIKKLKRPPKV